MRDSRLTLALGRFTNEATRAGKTTQLTDISLVVDALGEDAK